MEQLLSCRPTVGLRLGWLTHSSTGGGCCCRWLLLLCFIPGQRGPAWCTNARKASSRHTYIGSTMMHPAALVCMAALHTVHTADSAKNGVLIKPHTADKRQLQGVSALAVAAAAICAHLSGRDAAVSPRVTSRKASRHCVHPAAALCICKPTQKTRHLSAAGLTTLVGFGMAILGLL